MPKTMTVYGVFTDNPTCIARVLMKRIDAKSRFASSEYCHVIVASKKDHLLSLFHHIHHEDSKEGENDEHEIHHCGGEHKDLPYTIEHCSHGKHRIDKQEATGHGTESGTDLKEIRVKFGEKCSDGGWHVESGKVVDDD